jgi:hypothetical protein
LPVATYVVATGFFVLARLSKNPMHPQCTPRNRTEYGYNLGTEFFADTCGGSHVQAMLHRG